MSRYTFPHAGDCKLSEAYNKAREADAVADEFVEDFVEPESTEVPTVTLSNISGVKIS